MNYCNSRLLDFLALVSAVLDILNYIQNLTQTNNDTILKELQHQNQDYLERIIKELENNKKSE